MAGSSLLALSISIGLMRPASAAPVITIGGEAAAGGPAETYAGSSATYVEDSRSVFAGPSNGYAFSLGADDGRLRVQASGNGTYTASSFVRYEQTFTNNSGAAALGTFNFRIEGGYVSAYNYGSAADSFSGRVGVSILLNTTEMFAFDASAAIGSSGGSYSATDPSPFASTFFSTSENSAYYGFGGQYFSFDIGLVDAGESFSITYLMEAESSGNYTAGTDCGYGGYGSYGSYGSYGGYGSCSPGYAYARIGDPFSADLVPFDVSFRSPSAVDAPESAALLMTGLAGLAAASAVRRRKRSAERTGW